MHVDWDPRIGVTADAVLEQLDADPSIRAVLVVHNETSTGVTTDIEALHECDRVSEDLLVTLLGTLEEQLWMFHAQAQ